MAIEVDEFQKKIIEIVREVEVSELKPFTDSLINLVWAEICMVDSQSIDAEEVSAIAEELRQSLEIMNPELTNDVYVLNKLLLVLENYE